ncbi:MAG TPA: single-stranded DNA-binding protein [Saprospiraceae bacterium]|nr:single-stranded DNA-binding protein [Saprospiraceae bacterium]
MNNLRNQVQLIGHLGKNVNIKELDNGRKVATTSIATKYVYENKKGEKVVETQWHQLVGWGKNATNMESFLRKGKEVAVRGKLTYRKYTDKQGLTRYLTEVVVNELLLVN